MKLNGNNLVWVIVSFCVGVALGALVVILKTRTQPAPIIITAPESTATPLPTATATPLRVFVSGEVAAPAVYDMPPGSILADAIKLAGGFTAEAHTHALNLAMPLADGLHVHVPATGDTVIAPVAEPAGAVHLTVSGSDSPAGETSAGLININTATPAELNTLPGIGPSTSQNIIEYREANGPFIDIADIKNVAGIGDARFEQIKALITTE